MRNRILLSHGLKCLTGALVLITFGAGVPAAQAPATSAPTTSAPTTSSTAADRERAFMKQYCVSCHNAKLRTGGLALDTFNVEDIPHSGETLEKVVRKVWGGSMPPAQAPHPDKQTVSAFLSDLEGSLDKAAAAHLNPGQPTMLHRMNRTEYLNAVHDLFDLEVTKDDAALLPADDLSYGFDNNGDVLGMPPLLLERYLSIARRVSVAALGPAPGTEAPVNVYTQTVEYGPSQSKWSEGMPPGTRGGLAFDYHFPADGEYSIRVRLQRRGGRIAGFPNLNQAVPDDTPQRQRMVVGLDGKTVGLFLIGVDQTVVEKVPESEEGLADLPEPPLKELTRAEITNRGFTGDDNLEIKLAAKAGNRHLTAAFLARYVPVPAQLRDPLAAGQGADARPMGIYSVTVTGPFHSQGPGNTSSRQRILVCNPATPAEEAPCVRKILTTLAHRAYRHPPTPSEMQELLTAYERGRKGGNFEAGLAPAIRRMLMDPAFLFRIELDPPTAAPGKPYRISELELATRLSFFLWSSLPDEELLKTAESGQLKDPAVLEREVRRMLADRRAHALVSNFASEWLGLRVVAGVQPDPVIFSDFDGLKEAFQKETELLLNEVLLGDRSVTELLNGKYTYVNERLAKHYGIPNIYGDRFRRVTVTDGVRGGLLGQGGILTATSYPNRTSPVLRGKWVLDNLLGSPPPPPPPNVPPFPEADGNGRVLSVRERLAEHRKNAVCASCHVRMDPLGLALENFDATGKWRTGEPAALGDLTVQPIDASGQLTDGTKFEGVAGLRRVLQDHSEEFVYTMTERLLTYGLGRGTEWFDQPSIRAAVRAAKADDYRFSALVLNLVKSPPFRMRMALDTDSGKVAESGRTAGHTAQAAVAQK